MVAPSVSTAARRSISAFFRAMRHRPRASARVATIGRPSGMAATASAMLASAMRRRSLPAATPRPARRAAVARTAQTIWPDRRSRRRSSGEASGSAPSTSCDTWPSSVPAPVATTTPVPLPRVTSVPRNIMEARSAKCAPGATGSADLSTGTASPVSMDSSTPRFDASISRRSAGTASPPSTSTMSPGTSCSAASTRACPSRRTRAACVHRARNPSTERAARSSVKKPRPVLTARTATIAAVSRQSPKASDRAAAAASR